MIGRVGDDAFGQSLRRSLQEYGVVTDHVLTSIDCSSGVALITVDASGANSIVVVAGANGTLSPADVRERAALIAAADALIVQLETPMETIAAAIQVAKQSGVRTILDPAPAPAGVLPPEFLTVDLISPNQTEAEALTGVAVHDVATAVEAASRLQRGGAREVVLKLGELGALVASADGQTLHVPARSAAVVDTTAAGDAFTAALAVALAESRSLADAAAFGCACGTLACTRFGAQPAMPARTEVEAFSSGFRH